MSFSADDINSRETSDLTPEQLQVMYDWEKRFIEGKKYPVVGRLPPVGFVSIEGA